MKSTPTDAKLEALARVIDEGFAEMRDTFEGIHDQLDEIVSKLAGGEPA